MRRLQVIFVVLVLASVAALHGAGEENVGNWRSMDNVRLYRHGLSLYEKERYREAIEVFGECIKRNFNRAMCHYKTGNSYWFLKDYNNALLHLEKSLEYDPGHYESWFNIAAMAYEKGDFIRSVKYYEKAVTMRKNDDNAWYGLAAAYYALARYDKSMECNSRALRINPKNEKARKLDAAFRKMSGNER